ncbi:MAG: ferritin family protein [Proteobacteria bacterium]|nr:ferritin family protein [Pseudomonadota bacterium]
MSSVFNAEEVLEIAVQIERAGAVFYRRAATLVDDPISKEMLEGLAAMEDGHEIGFENMRADPDTLSILIGDPEGEAALYLRAFASGRVFPKDDNPASELGPNVTMEEILKKAINMELTSIAFYQGIKNAMPPELGEAKVDEIIQEEMRHVTTLTDKLESVTKAI